MTFRRAIRAITPAQQEMQDKMRSMGCVACRDRGYITAADIHHLTRNGMQLGHEYTVALCKWHHQALPFVAVAPYSFESKPFATPIAWLREFLGPSLGENPRAFRATFGSDQELLDKQRDAIRYPLIKLPDRADRKRKGSTKTPSKSIPRRVA